MVNKRPFLLTLSASAFGILIFICLRAGGPSSKGIVGHTPSVTIQDTTQPVIRKREIVFPASGPEFPPSPDLHRYKNKPQDNTIEFKVVDGLAVAFGDILLGKPEAGTPLDRGYYDAPNPQNWNHSIVPYAISPDLPNPERVEKAISYFKAHTPIQFVPYQGQKDAIVFEPGKEHCLSALGKLGGLQPIKLAPDCQGAEILHEIMHSLGFIHEQSRPDRDQYVEILWQNIDPTYQSQFAIVPENFADNIKGSSFDFHSVMLYDPHAFALKPDLVTLRSLTPEAVAPMQNGLSESDIKRLNRVYSPYE